MIKELTMGKTSLPVGWEVKIFDEVINFSQIGLVRNNKEQSLEYDFRYLKMNNINNDNGLNEDSFKFVNATNEEVEKYQLVNDDFLFNTRNSFELVGKSCLYQSDYKKPTLFNNNILRVRFKEFLVPEFVAYAFSSKQLVDDLEKLKSGTTNVVGIYYKSLKNLEIPVPPLPQQKQIVEILDKAFAAIDTAKTNAEQNLQNAKELFESYLQNVFENKGDDWESCELNDFVNFIDYRGRTPVKTSSGVRLITAKNIKLGYLQQKPEEFIATDNYESWMTRGIPNFGDIIFTTEAPLGNIAQVNTKEKIAFAQRVIVMQPDPSKINQTFLKYLLLSNPIRNKILAQATGATVLGIKSRLLKKIGIDFPKSIKEQQKIVKGLDSLSTETKKLEAIYTQKIADLEELKKSVLQKAFSGQLTTNN